MAHTEDDTHFDLLVIGFGKAGKTLAMARAEAGDRVALVEQDRGMYGGTCINIACVPTKALLSATSRGMNLQQAQGTRDELVEAMNRANTKLADDAGVTVINARARFTGARSVTLSGGGSEALTLTGDAVVVNTGSAPVWPDLPGIDSPRVYDSTSIQHVSPAPRRVVIVGGGPIGVEFATLFTGQSAEVTIVDTAPSPLSQFDRDVAAEARDVLQQRGVTFVSDARATDFETAGDEVVVRYARGSEGAEHEITADAVLVAIGRRPATDGLGLDATGVEVGERGEVVVDDFLRTSAAGVYAAGDVTGGPQFTYVSYDDHRVIAGQLSGGPGRSTAGRLIPTTTFLDPPLSTLGMSEDEARESGREIDVRSKKVADIPIMPRPKIVGRPEGLARCGTGSPPPSSAGGSTPNPVRVRSSTLCSAEAIPSRPGIPGLSPASRVSPACPVRRGRPGRLARPDAGARRGRGRTTCAPRG